MVRPWRKHGEQPFQSPRIFRLLTERFESPRNGHVLDATLIDSPDWVNVIALTPDEEVVLVRQYRFGPDVVTEEVPGGAIDGDEPPLQAAQRELREETGYVSEAWQSLGAVQPNPAFMRNRLHLFLARGCRRVGKLELDAGEDIEVTTRPLPEVRDRLRDGRMDNALVMAAFLRFELTQAEGIVR